MSEFIGTPESAAIVSDDAKNPASVITHDPKTGKKLEANKNSVSKKLAKIMPSRTPLDSMLRNIGNGSCKSDKYEFFSIISRGVKATVKEILNITDGIAELKLDSCHCLSLDGDLLVPYYNVSAGNISAPDKGVPTRPLILHIVEISYSSKTIKVVGVNATLTTANFTQVDKPLYRLASAKDQDAAISNDPHAVPTKDYNFCQRNVCTISENAFQALQEKEVEFGMAEFKEQALYDFRWQSEMSSIFGANPIGGEGFIDPVSNKRKLHMRGLLDFNIQQIDCTDESKDIAERLNEAMEAIFAGNNGSEERVFIYGPEVATMMANSKSWQKRMDAAKTEVKWGVTWKLIETNFGTLRGVMQPAFGLLGDYSRCALVVDPANIRRVEQVALHSRNLDLQSAGVRNSKDVFMEEAWTLEVTNPYTHAFMQF